MRNTRIFHAEPLSLKQTVTLSENAARHIRTVLRLAVNDAITLFNGDGCDYHAKITAITKKSLKVTIVEKIKIDNESALHIHLGQAISRNDRMDIALQKAVELGVQEITPLITQHCAIKINDDQLRKKQQHWQGIIISACEQSGRAVLPILHPAKLLQDWLVNIHHEVGIVADPLAQQSLKALSLSPTQISLLIGPEGGLHHAEIMLAKQQHFHTIQLGKRILRTETAAIASISVIQSYWGDF